MKHTAGIIVRHINEILKLTKSFYLELCKQKTINNNFWRPKVHNQGAEEMTHTMKDDVTNNKVIRAGSPILRALKVLY